MKKHLITVKALNGRGVASAYTVESEQGSEAFAEIKSMFDLNRYAFAINYVGEIKDVSREIREAVAEVRREVDYENNLEDDDSEAQSAHTLIRYAEELVEKLEAML